MVEREIQMLDEIALDTLLVEADALKLDNWRLVQILCVATEEGYELSYSFGGGYAMRTLRVRVGRRDPVPSITPHFGAAFLYENEIRDLFGVRIERIDPDWLGKVYDVEKEKPFAKMPISLPSSEHPTPQPRVDGLQGKARPGDAAPEGGSK